MEVFDTNKKIVYSIVPSEDKNYELPEFLLPLTSPKLVRVAVTDESGFVVDSKYALRDDVTQNDAVLSTSDLTLITNRKADRIDYAISKGKLVVSTTKSTTTLKTELNTILSQQYAELNAASDKHIGEITQAAILELAAGERGDNCAELLRVTTAHQTIQDKYKKQIASLQKQIDDAGKP